jgi:hypothetical protein
MVRSLWKRTLVASFAWAGLAWAQQPNLSSTQPAPMPSSSAERVVTVQEPGKPGQKCKVVKTWHTADGTTAYQVKTLTTGEMMTLVESGPAATIPGTQSGTRVQAMATKIFHWGRSKTAPAGSPIPPADAMPAAPTFEASPPATTTIMPISHATPTPLHETAPANTQIISERITPVPMATPTETPSSITPAPNPTVISREEYLVMPPSAPVVPHEQMMTTTTSECPCNSATEVKTAPCAPCGDSKETVVVHEGDTQVQVLTTTPYPTVTSTEPSKPTDWRQSWGKADDHKSSHFTLKSLLPQANTKKPDPLQTPTEYRHTEIIETASTPSEPVHATATVSPLPIVPSQREQVRTTGTETDAPLGFGSVRAAISGDTSGVHYAPVPIVTIPDLAHPPTPPTASLPQPPQPPRFGNAMPTGPMFVPMNRALGPTPTTTDPGMTNAFTSMPSDEAVAHATNAFGPMPAQPAAPMGAGYGQPAPGAFAPNGYAGVNAMPPAVNAYSGQPAGIVQAGYQPPLSQPTYRPQPVTPAMENSMANLKSSLYPSQREWAAECLSTVDWHTSPQIVQALVTGAHEDPAASVRAACIHSLAKMKCNAPEVMATIEALHGDMDPRVRQEVDHALTTLGGGHMTTPATPAVIPAAVIPSR